MDDHSALIAVVAVITRALISTVPVTLIAVVTIATLPLVTHVLALMLEFDGVICFFMLIAQILVELRVLPRRQTFLVCLGMLCFELIVNVAMLIIELLMLMIMTAPLSVCSCGNGETERRRGSDCTHHQLTHDILLQ